MKYIIHLIRTFLHKVNEDDVAAYSGQAALFILISFFPFVMFLLTLIQFLPFTETDLQNLMLPIFPEIIHELIQGIIAELYHSSTGTVISVTVITALWSASRGFLAIIRGLNSVYHIDETRGYFRLRFFATLHTLGFALILLLTLALLVFGNTLYAWCINHFPEALQVLFMVINIRTILTLLLLILFFWLLYVAVPNRPISTFRQVSPLRELPGAVLTACGWMLFSYAYSYYIEHFADYSYMYGSLTAIVLLMLWLYFCMYILFLGAEFNTMLARISWKAPKKH